MQATNPFSKLANLLSKDNSLGYFSNFVNDILLRLCSVRFLLIKGVRQEELGQNIIREITEETLLRTLANSENSLLLAWMLMAVI